MDALKDFCERIKSTDFLESNLELNHWVQVTENQTHTAAYTNRSLFFPLNKQSGGRLLLALVQQLINVRADITIILLASFI